MLRWNSSLLTMKKMMNKEERYMDDCVFEAYVTNLGKYNEGALVGEWVKFPTTPEEMQEVFKRIGINAQYEEYFITDYDMDIHGLYDQLGEYESLDKLNYLAGRLDEMSLYERKCFDAILESGLDIPGDGLVAYINLTYNLDKYEIYSGIMDEADLGRYWVEEGGYDTKAMGVLADYIDYEAFGRDIQMNENGMFTDAGYVRDNESSWDEYFNGELDDIPDEYRLGSALEEARSASKEQVIEAIEAAGYHYDELESSEDQLRFMGEGGTIMEMESWREAEDWLEGMVFDDPAVSDRVEGILHPERMPEEQMNAAPVPEKDSEITVLVVEPMKEPYEKTIPSGLSSLQNEVGGMIQVVYPFEDPVGLICNDEGKINGMELNRALRTEEGEIYDIVAGTFLVAGLTEDNFGSLTPEQLETYSKLYQKPEIFAQIGGEIVAIPVSPEKEPVQENTFTIYQLKDSPETRDYRFVSMKQLKRQDLEVKPENYDQVYSGKLSSTDTLDSIYERFNLQHPDDFRGHSLSVSDVVVLHENGKDTAHYVDSFGFTEIPDFLQHDMALVDEKTSGLAVEGHFGTWHTIEKVQVDGKDYFLMEHDEFGDEAAGVVVDSNGRLMAEDVTCGIEPSVVAAIRETEADLAAQAPTLDVPQEAGAKDQMQRNHLAKVEEMVEDDYGMIDGIINNGSKAQEEEKSEGKKPSVMEKLQEKKAEVEKADKAAPEVKRPKSKDIDLS